MIFILQKNKLLTNSVFNKKATMDSYVFVGSTWNLRRELGEGCTVEYALLMDIIGTP